MVRLSYLLALACSTSWSVVAVAQTADRSQGLKAGAASQDNVSSATPTAAPSPPADQTDVVVTAQRRSEKLGDVPLSLTVATGEQLAAAHVTTPGDLEKLVPGFTYQRSSYGVPVYTIRGIGFLDTALGVPPTVSIYVDQVPLAFSPMAAGAALDVERVEVLKGPQGTLFGQNSTGGAINYVAAKPTDIFAAGGDLSYGRFNTLEAQGYASGPLTGTLKARFALRTEQSGDWQYSYTRHDTLGARHFTTGRLLLDWDGGNFGRWELNLNGWRDTSDTQAAQYFGYQPSNPAGADPVPAQILTNYPLAPRNARAADWNSTLDGKLKRDDWFYQVALRGDIPISDAISLSSITQWSDYRTDAPDDPDGVNFPNLQIFKSGKLQSLSQEVRLLGRTRGNELRWMVGGSYQYGNVVDEEGDTDATNPLINTVDSFFGIRLNGVIHDNKQKIDTYAAFGSLDYKLTDTLLVQGSVRYTDSHTVFRGCTFDDGLGGLASILNVIGSLIGIPANAVPGGCATYDSAARDRLPIYRIPLREHNVSWRGGLSWKPDAGSLLYANVTQGYKAGSFPTIAATDAVLFAPAKQEKVIAYEAGFRTSLLRGAVQLSGAVFHYDYSDKQVLGLTRTIFGNFPKLVNIPKSRVNGAEFDATLRPMRGLSMTGGISYVDSKVTSSLLASNALGAVIDLRGESFPNTPKWQMTGDVQYEFPLSAALQGYVGANGQYRTSAQAGFGRLPTFIIPNYGTLDVRAGVKGFNHRWYAEVWGRNVTNTLYWNNIAKLIDTYSRTTGLPVTYGVRAGFSF